MQMGVYIPIWTSQGTNLRRSLAGSKKSHVLHIYTWYVWYMQRQQKCAGGWVKKSLCSSATAHLFGISHQPTGRCQEAEFQPAASGRYAGDNPNRPPHVY